MDKIFTQIQRLLRKRGYKKKNGCSFQRIIYSLLERVHSRRDQRDISARPTSGTSGVDQGCLDESTTFAVKSATPWRIKLVFFLKKTGRQE